MKKIEEKYGTAGERFIAGTIEISNNIAGCDGRPPGAGRLLRSLPGTNETQEFMERGLLTFPFESSRPTSRTPSMYPSDNAPSFTST